MLMPLVVRSLGVVLAEAAALAVRGDGGAHREAPVVGQQLTAFRVTAGRGAVTTRANRQPPAFADVIRRIRP